jgi:transcriptional regulator with XRE-family HTH domain
MPSELERLSGTAPLRLIVGANIRRLRESHGLSQSQLAEAVGTSTKTIVSIEKAHAATNLDLLERIAHQLDADPGVLARRA